MSGLYAKSPRIHRYSTSSAVPLAKPQPRSNYVRVLERLRDLGMSRFGFMYSEVRYLPQLIGRDEHIGGVIQGRGENGHIMLAATDRRVLFLDTKPLFIHSEDISYESIAAITFEWIGFSGTMILHTRLGDFKLRVTNRKTAEIFRSYVERRCIDRN